MLHYALHIFPCFLKSFQYSRRKWNQWPCFRAYFRRQDLVEIYMTVTAFSVLIVHYPTFKKYPWWRLILYHCVYDLAWGSSHDLFLSAWLHMSNPPAQSGSKLWPKSANESLAVKGMSLPRSDHDGSIASSVSLAVVTLALDHEHGDGIDGRGGGLTQEWGRLGPVLDDLIPPRWASPWTLQYWCYCLNSYKWEA